MTEELELYQLKAMACTAAVVHDLITAGDMDIDDITEDEVGSIYYDLLPEFKRDYFEEVRRHTFELYKQENPFPEDDYDAQVRWNAEWCMVQMAIQMEEQG